MKRLKLFLFGLAMISLVPVCTVFAAGSLFSNLTDDQLLVEIENQEKKSTPLQEKVLIFFKGLEGKSGDEVKVMFEKENIIIPYSDGVQKLAELANEFTARIQRRKKALDEKTREKLDKVLGLQ